MKTKYNIGDAIRFNRDNGTFYEGWIMWFYPDGKVQVSDNKRMNGQNFVISEEQIFCKVNFPFSHI